MIDGIEKLKGQLAFSPQNSRVLENRSKIRGKASHNAV